MTSQPINKREFKEVFDQYYPSLCLFAASLVGDRGSSEDLVQEVFLKLWEKRDHFINIRSIRSYLYTAVKNNCLKYLEHQEVVHKHKDHLQIRQINNAFINDRIIEEETHRLIRNAVEELPDACQEIIRLSLKDLKNREIAAYLNISENTVKTQKKIAYRQLRVRLKDVLPAIGLFLGSMF